MFTVPGVMPATIPDEDPTVAIAVLLLLQDPPGTVAPEYEPMKIHNESKPDIVPGSGRPTPIRSAVVAVALPQPLVNV